MLKKRLIGVITVKEGLAVQSFGYFRHLPLGRPEILAENLDRWGCDEILVLCIDRSRLNLGPDFELLKKLGEVGLSTPLIYGGGIRSVKQAAMVVNYGADRVCLDAALHHDAQPIRDMATLLGAQALIGAMPLSLDGKAIQWRDYRSGLSVSAVEKTTSLFAEGVISEALIIDWSHEGERNAFNSDLVHCFPYHNVPLIVFGGISEPMQAASLLALPNVAAVAVGNFLSYKEFAVQHFKEHLGSMSVRPPVYASSN